MLFKGEKRRNIEKTDREHLWHPLTQHQTALPPVPIKKAKGVYLWDLYGNKYIDGIASWYTAMYGHCHPKLIKAISRQAKKLDQVVFTGFTHQAATDLAKKLMGILPQNQKRLFFSDNGSTSVEVAIKMALQYHFNNGVKKETLIAFEDGFHGDTFGAMSVSGLSVYNGPFEEFFIRVERIPVPHKDNIEQVMSKLQHLSKTKDIAGFVYEPLIQGAAGMKMHDAIHLDRVLAFCKQHTILCIADEVMTGFGKTGTYFASEQLSNQPDFICLSKALSAGMLPLALTSCTEDIYNAFLSDELAKGFFHGHTYSANPLACAVASAAIDLLNSNSIQNGIRRIEKQHRQFVDELNANHKVSNARCKGVILAFELNKEMSRYGNKRDELYQFFMRQGVYLRPLGNTIYISAPYTCTTRQMNKIYDAVRAAIEL
ncbi:MAG: adenosylmethionine--8-amino-7-oxononanoate transaminase [Flavobacteriaceae bacterium]